jgi:DNA-binding transcriptional MerR regulator
VFDTVVISPLCFDLVSGIGQAETHHPSTLQPSLGLPRLTLSSVAQNDLAPPCAVFDHQVSLMTNEPLTNASPIGANEQLSMLDGPATEGFPAKRTAEIVGITYRQLDYWARTDLVRPAFRAQGSGSRRAYSYKNLLELRAVKNLLDAGIKLESVRSAFDYLRDELAQDPTEVNLVISGKGSVLIRNGEQIIDLLREGQGVLNVLPLAGVKNEVDAKIVELYPEVAITSLDESLTAASNE